MNILTGLVFYMRNLFILSFTILVVMAFSTPVSAEIYPFVGETIGDNVHVRAGQSENFESLGMLPDNQEILVIEKKYSWYKIQLPQNFNLYLSEDFVLVHDSGLGEVLGDRINVRARPSLSATVVTQVSKEDTVTVDQVEDGWCHIRPVDDAYGWINEEYIKFVSKDTDSYSVEPLITVAELKAQEEKKRKEEERKKKAEREAKQKEEARRKISVRGKLKKSHSEYKAIGKYTVITDNNLNYILDESGPIFEEFVGSTVTINARITSFSGNRSPYPVIKINKIQLVL